MEEETLPSPSPIIPLFLLSSQLSRPTRAKMLAYTQANWPMRSCSGLESYLGSRCTTRYWVRGGGTLVCCPVLQILTLLYPIKCHFSHPFSNLASKNPYLFSDPDLEVVTKCNITCLHKNRNYVVIAEVKTKRKRCLNIHLEFTYYTFFLIYLELERRTYRCTTVVPL